MEKLYAILIFSIILFLLSQPISLIRAYDLPPGVISQLHTNLKLAFLYDYHSGFTTIYEWPLPIEYYQISTIGLNDLSKISSYNVLVIDAGVDYNITPVLENTQIEEILNFVYSGGGLIIAVNVFSDSINLLLSKLGIIINNVSKVCGGVVTIEKDGDRMLQHEITTGVNKIEAYYAPCGGELALSIDINSGEIFIKKPFIALAKSYGNGRLVFINAVSILKNYDGLRLAVNCVEWVSGFHPPLDITTTNNSLQNTTESFTYKSPTTNASSSSSTTDFLIIVIVIATILSITLVILRKTLK